MCVCVLACVHTHTRTSVIMFNIISTVYTSYYLRLQLEPHPTWLILTFLPPTQLFKPHFF